MKSLKTKDLKQTEDTLIAGEEIIHVKSYDPSGNKLRMMAAYAIHGIMYQLGISSVSINDATDDLVIINDVFEEITLSIRHLKS